VGERVETRGRWAVATATAQRSREPSRKQWANRRQRQTPTMRIKPAAGFPIPAAAPLCAAVTDCGRKEMPAAPTPEPAVCYWSS